MPSQQPTPAASTGNQPGSQSSDWRAMQTALMRVGEYLMKPTRLVLIGSSVGMWYGQPGRMTEDIDVWSPRSTIDLADITQACQKAGINFDPKGYDIERAGLYLQLVTPGVVYVGKWRNDESMFTTGNLEVVHPPAENVIASKLVRAAPHDLEDIVFLMSRLEVSMDHIRKAVGTLQGLARETAAENIVFLGLRAEILRDVNEAAATTPPAPATAPRKPRTP